MWEPILFPDLLYRLLLASPVKENQTIQGKFGGKSKFVYRQSNFWFVALCSGEPDPSWSTLQYPQRMSSATDH